MGDERVGQRTYGGLIVVQGETTCQVLGGAHRRWPVGVDIWKEDHSARMVLQPMKAIQVTKSIPRYALTKVLGRVHRPAFWGPLSMIRYSKVPEPVLPGPRWVRIKTRYAGICGSDMHTILLEDSPMLSAFVSFPFTLGHENVGVIAEVGAEVKGFAPGDRVVAESLLSCAARGFTEPCRFCQQGEYSRCERFAEGDVAPGLSIGYCADTGGSWSSCFVAHESQLFHVPQDVSNENALMVDAFCSALRPVLRNLPGDGDTVLVLGAGVVGLSVVAALRVVSSGARVIAVAKHAFQGEMARQFGADEVICLREGDLLQAIARATGGKLYAPVLGREVLMGGADMVFECTGSESSLADSLRLARSGARVILLGLASIPRRVDWTPIWLNELTVRGSFWCSTETIGGQQRRAFQVALDWMASGTLDLAPLVTHRFRLQDYRKALALSAAKGRHHVLKPVFAFD